MNAVYGLSDELQLLELNQQSQWKGFTLANVTNNFVVDCVYIYFGAETHVMILENGTRRVLTVFGQRSCFAINSVIRHRRQLS